MIRTNSDRKKSRLRVIQCDQAKERRTRNGKMLKLIAHFFSSPVGSAGRSLSCNRCFLHVELSSELMHPGFSWMVNDTQSSNDGSHMKKQISGD